MSISPSISYLRYLARLYGVQTSYYDVQHRSQTASTESLLSILRSLGAPIAIAEDALPACREKRLNLWRRPLEPVVVAWNGEKPKISLRLPAYEADVPVGANLELENGDSRHWQWRCTDLPVVKASNVEGTKYIVKELSLPDGLPWGYHRLSLEFAGKHIESLIISAPMKAYAPPEVPENLSWGAFLPLYALHTRRSWGGGDFSDLEGLTDWLGGLGGSVIATLPLLPAFFDDFMEISPYRPVSRLFWNEFYLDVEKVPELLTCHPVQNLLASSSFQNEIKALRAIPVVDFQRQMALKRQVLEELARCLFSRESSRLEELRCFAEANPAVADYARFRATVEKRHTTWHFWPQALRDGKLSEEDYNEDSRRYHLYVQWLAAQQIEDISNKIKTRGSGLYLDLPLGVHPDGYDAWRERSAFLPGISAGAPPDTVFTKGQNWAFPPLHPENIREQGYKYVIAYFQHHLKHAGILRIDHVMGFHRLFCIPRGMESSQGVYLRYHPEEFYAILSLESHRNKTMIVGEDLGIVPWYVRPAMNRHGLQRMYILRYELAGDPQKGVSPIAADSVASLNTHDMPPFAAFWQGLDIEQKKSLGLLDNAGAEAEKNYLQHTRYVLSTFLRNGGWLQEPDENTLAVLKACLSFLAASQARIVLVNLEDLWLETQPQNVPSTAKEYPNWQHRAKYSLEEFGQMPQVIDTLRIINQIRRSIR